MSNIYVSSHPLIAHKLSKMRDVATEPKKFRELVREIAGLLAYEATADLATTAVDVQTPLAVTRAAQLKDKIGLVPILRAGLGMVAKKRKSATRVEAINVVGDVKDCDVLLVDDITETAGTLTAAARLLRDNGARSVRAAVSHCVLNDVAYQRLSTGLIDELITTNSVPVDPRGLPITVLNIGALLGQAIMRINSNESITNLFRIKGF